MNKKNIGRSALYLSMTMILAACGSSDGIGRNIGGAPDGKIVLDPNGYATRQASISSWPDVEAITQIYGDVLGVSYRALIDEIEERIGDDWDAPRSSGNRHTWNCENGTGTAVALVVRSSSYEQVQWQFTNCAVRTDSYGQLLLNGSIRYVEQLVSRNTTSATVAGSEEFQVSGTFLTSNEALKLQGRTDWNELYALDTDGFVSVQRIGALEFIRGNRYMALSNVTLNFASDKDDNEAIRLDGKVIGSTINGYVTLSTSEEIHQLDGKMCPEKGIVRIAGSGNTSAEVLFGLNNGISEAAVVEINNGSVTKRLTCAEAGRLL